MTITRQDIARAVIRIGDARVGDIAHSLPTSCARSHIKSAMVTMAKLGLLERVGYGIYRATEAGRSLAASNPERHGPAAPVPRRDPKNQINHARRLAQVAMQSRTAAKTRLIGTTLKGVMV